MNENSNETPSGSRVRSRGFVDFSLDAGIVVLFVAVLYRGAFSIGVLSDGWHLLEIGSRGFLAAARTVLSYHFIPIAHLFDALLWKLFGLWQTGYQLTNLALFALVAVGLSQLAQRLGFSRLHALFASLFFVANAAFFEIPFWPVVGSLQSLAVLFYLAGLFAALWAARRPSLAAWAAFALATAAAFFTYEPTVTVVPVGLGLAYLAGERSAKKETLRRLLGLAVAAVVSLGICLAIKRGIVTATSTHAFFLPTTAAEWNLRGYYFVRGLVSLATLRGSDFPIERVLSFGGSPLSQGTAPFDHRTHLWLGVFAVAAALTLWRAKSWTTRWLVFWLGLHLGATALAIGVASRHLYLVAIPSSLLLVQAVSAVVSFAGRRLALVSLGRAEAAALGIAFALALGGGSLRDLGRAGAVAQEATELERSVIRHLEAHLDQKQRGLIVLVNLPAKLYDEGIHAHAFLNGVHEFARLVSKNRVGSPLVANVYSDGREPPTSSSAYALSDLVSLAATPGNLVLHFNRRTRQIEPADAFTFRTVPAIDYEHAPYLDWQGTEGWHFVQLEAGRAFEVPIEPRSDSADLRERWVALTTLDEGGARYTWSAEPKGGNLPAATAPSAPGPAWITNVVPLPASVTRVKIQPATAVRFSDFAAFDPPRAYTPETATFLEWKRTLPLAFVLRSPVTLPLASDACRPRCTVVLRYWADPDRDFELQIGDRTWRADYDPTNPPGWRELEIPVTADARLLRVEFRPGSKAAPLIGRYEVR